MHISNNIIQLDTLESMIEHSAEWVKNFYEKEKELRTLFFGYVADGAKQVCFPVSFRSNSEKSKYLYFIKIAFAAYNIDKYVVMSESWALATSNPTAVHEHSDLSKHPDRVECLVIIAVNKYGNLMRTYKITTDKNLEVWHEMKNAEGQFTDLLPKTKITAEQRKVLYSFIQEFGNEENLR